MNHVVDELDPRELGKKLQESRKARRMTQAQVAEALSMARTTVTALEKGERRVKSGELVSLAKLYGIPLGRLVGERERSADFSVQLRNTVAHSAPGVSQALESHISEFRRLAEDYKYLEDMASAPIRRSYPPPYSIGRVAPEEAGEEVATAERNRLGLGEGPVLNLREILENDVGLRVFYMLMDSGIAGLYAYTDDLGGCISANSAHPEERRRASMSHEFAHFLSDRHRAEVSFLSGYERLPGNERFAEAFSRSFLMPPSGLRRRVNETLRATDGRFTAADVSRLAHYYFVSTETMTLRLEELRLLPIGTWERLLERGFRVQEAKADLALVRPPHPDDLLPLHFQLLAVRAYQEDKLSEGQIADLLRVDRVEVRRIVARLSEIGARVESTSGLSVDLSTSLREAGS